MKSMRKVIAALMVVVMSVVLFSTTAFAANNKSTSTDFVDLAKSAVEGLDTDDLYTGSIDDPILVYYASQPFSQPFAVLHYLSDSHNWDDANFKGVTQDLTVGVVSDLGGYYTKNYVSKTMTTIETTLNDIVTGLETAPDEIVESIDKYIPIASDVYEMTGPAGKLAIQSVLLPGYIATNSATLAIVLVGGGAALVIIFGLSGILSPALLVTEGPQLLDQFLKDMAEMDRAFDALS